MSSPRVLKEQIQRDETEILRLKSEEQTLNRERSELLLKSALPFEEEQRLVEVESKLVTLHDSRNLLQSRIAARKRMLPALEGEARAAKTRLEELRNVITPLAKEMTDSDTELAELYNRALERQQRINDLEQTLVGGVVEAQFLAKRFDLDGAGLRVPGRYHYDGIWQRIRVLAAFSPTRPADYTDKLRTLDQERNVREKKERRQALELQARSAMKLAG